MQSVQCNVLSYASLTLLFLTLCTLNVVFQNTTAVLETVLEMELTEWTWKGWWNNWSLLHVLISGTQAIGLLCLHVLLNSDEIFVVFIINEMYNQIKSWSKCEYLNELCFSTSALLHTSVEVPRCGSNMKTNILSCEHCVESSNRNFCNNLHFKTSIFTYWYWQFTLFHLQHAETNPQVEAH